MADSKPNRLAVLVPNFITCTSLAIGVSAILLSLHDQFAHAGWLLTLCVILDKLDGTAARLLKGGSELGVQLDSLSDFITFNVAPAVLVASVLTRVPGPVSAFPAAAIVYASAIVYVIGGAVRLARFNALEQQGIGLKDNFQGVPTTLSGAFVMAMVLVTLKHDLFAVVGPYLPGLLVVLAILMVSPFILPKLKKRRSKLVNAFTLFNLVTVPILIVLRRFPEYLLFLVLIYLVVGLTVANRKSYHVT